MTLIKSISGIRGTIGGRPGDSLTPLDIVKFTSAFGVQLRARNPKSAYTVVLGRDARVSGPMASDLVCGTLMGMGIDVIDLGLATTPTVEIAVTHQGADGGIILTASHNPGEWNALKLLNSAGEFISGDEGNELLKIAEKDKYTYAEVENLGRLVSDNSMNQVHIDKVLNLKLVDTGVIRKARFKVVIDCVNSVGGIIIPQLLKTLGVSDVIELNCKPTGIFPHNPEPLPQHLGEISGAMVKYKAHVGFVVDPDVDRLAIINEDGSMFGEEYTLVAIADYVLQNTPGNTVSNMSSTQALRDITMKRGGSYSSAPVGEVNVVKEMKRTGAIIGGEGNGGVIYPALHYGRDALVGIALFLSHLAKSTKKCSELRKSYPEYVISKNRIELPANVDVDELFAKIRKRYINNKINDSDGIKVEFGNEWVHLRKSNTEPIVRIYSESETQERSDKLAGMIIADIRELTK